MLLQEWRAGGDRLIVCLDANENIYTQALGNMLTDPEGLGMVEAVIHRQEDRGHLLPRNKANQRYLDYPGHNHRECMCDACGVRHRGPSVVHSGHTHLIVSWRRTTKREEGSILMPKHQVTPCCQEVCREPRGQPETAQANREARRSTHDWDKQRGCARESH